jgi:hypothetical protein
MLVEAETIDEWFAAAGDREPDLRRMDATITAYAPDLPRLFQAWDAGGPGLGYGVINYQPRSAKTVQQIPVLGLAPQKRHLALYACVVVDGQYLAERYQDRLGKVSCGKSCIRFTRYDRIDEGGLQAMLADVNERYRRGDHLYGP